MLGAHAAPPSLVASPGARAPRQLSSSCAWLRQLQHMLKKNALTLIRNRRSTAIQVLIPLVMILFLLLVDYGLNNNASSREVNNANLYPTPLDVGLLEECIKVDRLGSPLPVGTYTCTTLAYSPENDPVVEEVVSRFKQQQGIANTQAFATPQAFNEYVSNNPNSTQGAVHFSVTYTDQSAPSLASLRGISYVVQYNQTRVPYRNTFIRPQQQVLFPYIRAVNLAVLSLADDLGPSPTGDVAFDFNLQTYPHPTISPIDNVGKYGPAFFFGTLMFNIVMQLNQMVSERELHLRQSMHQMGLSHSVYWVSYGIVNFCANMLSALLLIAFGAAFQFSLFIKTNFAVLLVLFICFSLSLVTFVFLLTNFVSKARTGTVLGFAMFLIGILVQVATPIIFQPTTSLGVRFFFIIQPWALLSRAMDVIGFYATNEYLQGMSWHQRDDGFMSPETVYLLLLLDALVFLLLALYLDNVLPDSNGVSQSLLYCVQPSYWRPTSDRVLGSTEPSTPVKLSAEDTAAAAAAEEGAGEWAGAETDAVGAAKAAAEAAEAAAESGAEFSAPVGVVSPTAMSRARSHQSGAGYLSHGYGSGQFGPGHGQGQGQGQGQYYYGQSYDLQSSHGNGNGHGHGQEHEGGSSKQGGKMHTLPITPVHSHSNANVGSGFHFGLLPPGSGQPAAPAAHPASPSNQPQQPQPQLATGAGDEDEDVLAEAVRVRETLDVNFPVRITQLGKTFKGYMCCCIRKPERDFQAVKEIDLILDKNSLFCLLGHNGAGKSTTISMLTGLLAPSSGDARMLGYSISTGMHEIKKHMGVCPQHDVLFNELTAAEHLELFASFKGLPPESIEREVEDRLADVDLLKHKNTLAGTFSGGMKRRLSVAIALIGDPAVVFLDEPTTGMDHVAARQVWGLIEKVKRGRVTVLTTHSMEEADVLGDRIGIMKEGRLICLGSSLRLKTKYGSGYRVSVFFSSSLSPSDRAATVKRITAFFRSTLPPAVVEHVGKDVIRYSVPRASTHRLASFFPVLEKSAPSLGVVDIQTSLATLEQVFVSVGTLGGDHSDSRCGVSSQVGTEVGKALGRLRRIRRLLARQELEQRRLEKAKQQQFLESSGFVDASHASFADSTFSTEGGSAAAAVTTDEDNSPATLAAELPALLEVEQVATALEAIRAGLQRNLYTPFAQGSQEQQEVWAQVARGKRHLGRDYIGPAAVPDAETDDTQPQQQQQQQQQWQGQPGRGRTETEQKKKRSPAAATAAPTPAPVQAPAPAPAPAPGTVASVPVLTAIAEDSDEEDHTPSGPSHAPSAPSGSRQAEEEEVGSQGAGSLTQTTAPAYTTAGAGTGAGSERLGNSSFGSGVNKEENKDGGSVELMAVPPLVITYSLSASSSSSSSAAAAAAAAAAAGLSNDPTAMRVPALSPLTLPLPPLTPRPLVLRTSSHAAPASPVAPAPPVSAPSEMYYEAVSAEMAMEQEAAINAFLKARLLDRKKRCCDSLRREWSSWSLLRKILSLASIALVLVLIAVVATVLVLRSRSSDPYPPLPIFYGTPTLAELPRGQWAEIVPDAAATGARCVRGDPFSFFVFRPLAPAVESNDDSVLAGRPRHVLFHLGGRGDTCYDAATCNSVASTVAFDVTVDIDRASLRHHNLTGIWQKDGFNPDDTPHARTASNTGSSEDPPLTHSDVNPFAGYLHVYVPLCTADAHWGDATVQYAAGGITSHHSGARNAKTAFDWLLGEGFSLDRVPAPLSAADDDDDESARYAGGGSRVVVTGSGPGAWGAALWSAHIRQAYDSLAHVSTIYLGDTDTDVVRVGDAMAQLSPPLVYDDSNGNLTTVSAPSVSFHNDVFVGSTGARARLWGLDSSPALPSFISAFATPINPADFTVESALGAIAAHFYDASSPTRGRYSVLRANSLTSQRLALSNQRSILTSTRAVAEADSVHTAMTLQMAAIPVALSVSESLLEEHATELSAEGFLNRQQRARAQQYFLAAMCAEVGRRDSALASAAGAAAGAGSGGSGTEVGTVGSVTTVSTSASVLFSPAFYTASSVMSPLVGVLEWVRASVRAGVPASGLAMPVPCSILLV